MNQTIMALQDQLKDLKFEKEKLNNEILYLESTLSDSLWKENRLINNVLKHSLIEIISIIHNSSLKCSAVRNTETIWDDAVYTLSDGSYFIDIIAKNGTVEIICPHDNDGGGKELKRKAESMVFNLLIPFCEEHKIKHMD